MPDMRGRMIVLMGLRGSGKSTVGTLLAERLGLGFVDLDDLTPKELGETDAAESIRKHGFEAFREAEGVALKRVIGRGPIVLALGGGTPTAPGAESILNQAADNGALLVYLHAAPPALQRRLEQTNTASRPSLTGRGTLDEIEQVYRERDALYRDLCTLIVESEGHSPDAIADVCIHIIDQSNS